VINAGSNNGAPATDFFGHTRALTTRDPADVGAVEYTVATGAEASVTPVLLNFGNAGAGSSSVMPLTVRNDGSAALSGIAVAFGKGSSSPFSRPSANPGTCTAGNLASGTTCTINVVVSVPANATANSVVSDTAAVTVTTPGGTAVNGSPVSLSVTVVAPPIVTVKGGPLNFGNVVVGTIGAPQTLTVTNTGGSTFTGLTLAFSNPQFSRPSGAAGGTCGSSLDPGDGVTTGACTINVVFTPTVVGTVNGSATISGNAAAIGSPVTVGGTGTAPNQPHPAVLDGFNRANANTLGSSWDQIVLFGLAAIHVNANQALDPNLAGAAYWDNQYGTSQAAAFTFAAAPASGYALVLKATGGAASAPASYVRVRYTGSSVVVETTTNGIAFTSQATFNGTFAIGDTLTAMVDATGGAYVWKTTAANASSFLGGIAIPAASFPGASGSGRIGMQLPVNGRVDNFAGGNGP